MRQDFRVKMDISRIYQDARQYSWVFIDSTKVFYVNQLADHVRKLFNVKEPFYLLSRHEDTCFFLPFEEDIRILENNDTVVWVFTNKCYAWEMIEYWFYSDCFMFSLEFYWLWTMKFVSLQDCSWYRDHYW